MQNNGGTASQEPLSHHIAVNRCSQVRPSRRQVRTCHRQKTNRHPRCSTQASCSTTCMPTSSSTFQVSSNCRKMFTEQLSFQRHQLIQTRGAGPCKLQLQPRLVLARRWVIENWIRLCTQWAQTMGLILCIASTCTTSRILCLRKNWILQILADSTWMAGKGAHCRILDGLELRAYYLWKMIQRVGKLAANFSILSVVWLILQYALELSTSLD